MPRRCSTRTGANRSPSGRATSSRSQWCSRAWTSQQAETIWRPFFEWVAGSPQDFSVVESPKILAVPARHLWNAGFLKQVPGLVLADERPGASEANVFWASNLQETGQVLHGYQSAWLPASL